MDKIYRFRLINKAIKNGYANNDVSKLTMLTGQTTLTDKEHAMIFTSKLSEAEYMLKILNQSRKRFELEVEEAESE